MEATVNRLSKNMSLALAMTVGVLVANLYYMQPIVDSVAHSLSIAPEYAGLVITLTQIGYGLSVLFLIPLGDILENRNLILSMMLLTLLGVISLSFSQNALVFFIAAFVMGVGASCVQAIVPYVANMSAEAVRGQAVGSVMSGLMFGIMLARPVSSLVTDLVGWQAVFILSSLFLAVLCFLLRWKMPQRHPLGSKLSYWQLLRSMPRIYGDSEILRRRAIYQGFLFAAFCIFWTASPLYLLGPSFQFSHSQVALFALVGVAGAIVAPYAGRMADRGWIKRGTFISLLISILSFGLSHIFEPGSLLAILFLGIAAVVLDAGITANLVLGQRAIFALPEELRNRLNGLYIATIFVGGALGSALGVWSYETGGWTFTVLLGAALPTLALLYFLTEKIDLYKN